MEPILFYGDHAASSFGTIVALEWLGQPYRLHRLELPRATKTAFYARINPVQKVPALLLEDGSTLSESIAILPHLAARDPDRRSSYAPGTREHDHLNQVLGFLHTDFCFAFAPAFKAFDMDLMGTPDPAIQQVLRELGREEVTRAHAHLEAMMGDGAWLAGPKRTIADAYFVGVARWAAVLAETGARLIEPAAYPRLSRHVEKLEADPAVRFAHAIEDGRPATSAGGFRGHVSVADVEARRRASRDR